MKIERAPVVLWMGGKDVENPKNAAVFPMTMKPSEQKKYIEEKKGRSPPPGMGGRDSECMKGL